MPRNKTTPKKRKPAKTKQSNPAPSSHGELCNDPKDFQPSKEARAAVKAAINVLPNGLQKEGMQLLLLKTLYNGRYRREFCGSPREELKQFGIDIPTNVKIDVHENTENTVHIILPGVAMDTIPRKAAGKPALPLAVFEAAKGGGVDIRDVDMTSGPAVALFDDDFTNGDGKDPKTADTKGDGTGAGSDTSNWLFSNNDKTTTTKDVSDTGKD